MVVFARKPFIQGMAFLVVVVVRFFSCHNCLSFLYFDHFLWLERICQCSGLGKFFAFYFFIVDSVLLPSLFVVAVDLCSSIFFLVVHAIYGLNEVYGTRAYIYTCNFFFGIPFFSYTASLCPSIFINGSESQAEEYREKSNSFVHILLDARKTYR